MTERRRNKQTYSSVRCISVCTVPVYCINTNNADWLLLLMLYYRRYLLIAVSKKTDRIMGAVYVRYFENVLTNSQRYHF